uniref:CCHC-type domain-containing protein n=1 Tax=Aegilops tauschii subsp. strangulata TaxID=200361 RepID=A0A452YM47_AEGTS
AISTPPAAAPTSPPVAVAPASQLAAAVLAPAIQHHLRKPATTAAIPTPPAAGASASGLVLQPPASSSGPVQSDLATEASLRPSCGQLRAPAQMDGGAVLPGLVTDEATGWKLVQSRRARQALPSPALKHHERAPPPMWLRNKCFRCFAKGHRAAKCRDPVRCIRCFQSGHRARDGCQPMSWPTACPPRSVAIGVCPPQSMARSWASVVAFHGAAEIGDPPTAPADVVLESAFAVDSLLSNLQGLTSSQLKEAVQPLRDVVGSMQGWMLQMGNFLERADAVLSGLSQVPSVLQTSVVSNPLDVHDVNLEDECSLGLHGCFSPRARVRSPLSASEGSCIDAVVAPVLQIMTELLELCRERAPPLSVEQLKVDLPPTLCEGQFPPPSCEQLKASESIMLEVAVVDDVGAVSMLAPAPVGPSQPLALGARGGSDVAVTQSHVAVGRVETVRDKVDAILFEIEVHSLLKRLEAACPGSGRTIVEKALRNRSKKNDATEMASATVA